LPGPREIALKDPSNNLPLTHFFWPLKWKEKEVEYAPLDSDTWVEEGVQDKLKREHSRHEVRLWAGLATLAPRPIKY